MSGFRKSQNLLARTWSVLGRGKGRSGSRRKRSLSLESLERRELLTITVSAWTDDGTAGESLDVYGYPSNTGVIAVELSESSSSPMDVRIDLSGTSVWHPGPYGYDDYLDYCPPPAGVDWIGLSSVPATKIDSNTFELTFPAYETYVTLEIIPFDDTTYEGTEAATVTVVSNGSAYSIDPYYYSGTVAIYDNDSAPLPDVWVSDYADGDDVVATSESDAPYAGGRIRVERDTTSGNLSVGFSVSTVQGSPVRGSDYVLKDQYGTTISGNTMTISSGYSYKDVYVYPVDDSSPEGTETFNVAITTSSSYTINDSDSGYADIDVSIADNDAALPEVTVSSSDRFATEPAQQGETATDTAEYTISLSQTSSTSKTVYFSLSGKATPGTDYTMKVKETGQSVTITGGSGSVTIPAYISSRTLVVQPVYDTLDEKVELATLQITSASGYAVGTPEKETVAIMDPGVVHIPSNDDLVIPGGGCGSGNHTVCFDCLPGIGCFGYSSDANPHPTVAVDALIQRTRGTATLSTVTAALNLGGVQKTVYYDGTGISATDLYRLAVQVDASSLGTGRHDWTMTVTQTYSDSSTRVDTYTDTKNLIDARGSAFGRRWGAGEYQMLMSDSDGVLWMYEGNLRLFANDGSGGYEDVTDPLGHWTLTGSWSTGFTLTHADGNKETFNTSGVRTKSADRNGNETAYSYTSGRLTGVTYPGGRQTTLAYDANGHLDYVDDFAGRRTDFTIDSYGQIQSIALPDPDGAGGDPAPTYDFHYESSTGMMDWMDDPEGVRTRYVHDSTGLLSEMQHADGTSDEWANGLVSAFAQGLKYEHDGTGSWSSKATLTDYLASSLTAKRIHSANPTYGQSDPTYNWEVAVDRFGQPTSMIDYYGNETRMLRDENGQVVRLVEPDPDGAGSQVAAETKFTYDSRGNMLTIEYADGSIETWTYHATHNVPTSYTFTPPPLSGEDTLKTVYTIDATTGNVTRERQIKNLDDSVYGGDASANPDVVIDYVYTDGTETNSPPKGLLETVTFTSHPDAPVTSYEYTHYGELDKVTYPDPDGAGALRSPVLDYAWSTNGLLAGTLASVTETDAGANYSYTTNYEYYNDQTLKKVVYPDPDGAGPLPRPEIEYTYNADGTIATVTETTSATGADELVTSYTYTNGMLTRITYPDPDGAGAQYSPVTEYGYSAGLLTSVTETSSQTGGEAHLTQHVYDAMNRLRKTVHPDPDGAGSLPRPVQRYYYDGAGRVYRTREQTSNAADPIIDTDYAYDTLGRLTEVKLPDADTLGGTNRPTTVFTYYATGQIETMTDPLGAVSTYDYNDLGQLVKVTLPDPDGVGAIDAPTLEYQYDAAGRLTAEIQSYLGTNSQELVTRYVYDKLDRILSATLPDPDDYSSAGGSNGALASPVVSYGYDAAGNLATVTDPRSGVTRYQYDMLGRQTAVTDALGAYAGHPLHIIATRYDELGNVSSVTDQLGRTTTYQYDLLGRLTAETLPDPGTGLPPAGHWRLETDASGVTPDATGNGHDGELYGDAAISSGMLYLDGSAAAVVVDEAAGIDMTDSLTIRARVYATSLSGYHAIIAERDGGEKQFTLIADSNGILYFSTTGVDGASSQSGAIWTGEWLDVIATHDGSTGETRFYVNGRDVTSDSTCDLIPNATTDLYVGACGYSATTGNTDVGYVWSGYLSSVRLYDQVLTPEEMPLVHLPFNLVEGDDTVDATGNGHDGAPYGDAYVAGGVLWLDGTQDAVVVPEHFALDMDDSVSISARVYADELSLYHCIVAERDGSEKQFTLIADSNGVLHFSTTGINGARSQSGAISAGEWYDVVVTHDGVTGETRFYVDGLDVTYDSTCDLIPSATTDLYIGACGYSATTGNTQVGYEWHGAIADFRLYNTVLSADQAADLDNVLTTSYAYDPFGNLTGVTDPKWHTTAYDYDGLNRLVETTLHSGADTLYAYNNLGRLASVTDPTGNVTSYGYDYLHRLTSETITVNSVPLTESYDYDLAGNLIWMEDRLDRITRWDRDALGRTFRERWKDSGGSTIRTLLYDFDDLGRLAGVSDPAAAYDYSYDLLGRVTFAEHTVAGLTPTVSFDQQFDAAGNRTQMAAIVGVTPDFVNDFSHDALGRMTQVTQQGQSGGNAVAEKLVQFDYDATGRFSQIRRYADLLENEYVARTDFGYDAAGRLTGLAHTGGGLAASIDYTLSYDDHLLDSVSYGGKTIDYGYDSVDQLTGVDYAGTGTPTDEAYSYDDSGNRTNTGYSTGDHNRLEEDGTYTYSYDANGNRTARFVDADSSGTLNSGDTSITEYTWDHRNRLTSVTDRATYGGSTTQVVEYEYDAYNRLVHKELDADGDGAGSATDTFWVYDGSQAILQFDGSAAADLSHRYLWGPAVDQLLADETVDDGGAEDVLWPLTDWQGSVRHLAGYNDSTDVTTIANEKFYDAYGNVTSETNALVDTVFGWTARFFDDDTGQQNNLNRWYDPLTGTWPSADPEGFAAGDPNLYRYVGNSPGMYVDPSGLEELPMVQFNGTMYY